MKRGQFRNDFIRRRELGTDIERLKVGFATGLSITTVHGLVRRTGREIEWIDALAVLALRTTSAGSLFGSRAGRSRAPKSSDAETKGGCGGNGGCASNRANRGVGRCRNEPRVRKRRHEATNVEAAFASLALICIGAPTMCFRHVR